MAIVALIQEPILIIAGAAGKNALPVKIKAEVGKKVHVPVGTIVEEQILVINPKKRYFVAIKAPFAAGFEPMNPNLATASSSAKPEGVLTRQPDYAIYGDDAVTFYFDELEKGTYHFYYRLKGHIEGSFVHPPAKAEMMYRLKTRGNSPGMRILIDSEKE